LIAHDSKISGNLEFITKKLAGCAQFGASGLALCLRFIRRFFEAMVAAILCGFDAALVKALHEWGKVALVITRLS
jgi:hypothetical protein